MMKSFDLGRSLDGQTCVKEKHVLKCLFIVALIFAFSILYSVPSSRADIIYSQNFETGTLDAKWTGAGSIQPTYGLSAFGFGTNHLRNDGQDASMLTLNGLVPHTSLTLTFDLAMWDSIDYHDTNLDIFKVFVNGGANLYTNSFGDSYFGNYWGNNSMLYGFNGLPSALDRNSIGPGTAITPLFSDTDYFAPSYGYGGFRDSARHVSYTFAHSDPLVVISFQYPNSQGGLD